MEIFFCMVDYGNETESFSHTDNPNRSGYAYFTKSAYEQTTSFTLQFTSGSSGNAGFQTTTFKIDDTGATIKHPSNTISRPYFVYAR